MFKFVVVLCVVFVVSPVIAELNLTILDPEYLKTRNDWNDATLIVQEAMKSCKEIARKSGSVVVDVRRMKLNAVFDYGNTTMIYANRTLQKIIRDSNDFVLATMDDIEFHVNRTKQNVTNLIRQADNADVSMCEIFSETLTTMLTDRGNRLIGRVSDCIEKNVSKAIRLVREIDETIIMNEIRRIGVIFDRVTACSVDGPYPMTVHEFVQCHRQGKLQIAKGGVTFVNDVRKKIGELESLLEKIWDVQDECAKDAGLFAYYEPLYEIMEKTRACVDEKLVEVGSKARNKSVRN